MCVSISIYIYYCIQYSAMKFKKFSTTIPEILTGQIKETKKYREDQKTYSSVTFSCCCQDLSFWRETGHYTLIPAILDISLIFPNFLSLNLFGSFNAKLVLLY